jgi:hypothetical protein
MSLSDAGCAPYLTTFPSRPDSCPLFFKQLEFANFILTLTDNPRLEITLRVGAKTVGSGPEGDNPKTG